MTGSSGNAELSVINMRFIETELKGAFVIEPERIEDSRGFFARAFCENEFMAHGLNTRWVQSNISFNERAGTLRGMHYQKEPYAEIKLVRCTRGGIYDVIVDLRDDSTTYRQWFALELTESNHRMLYIPKGFAHGFLTLSDDTEVFYQHSEFYTPSAASGFMWNDASLNIKWPDMAAYIMSDQDRSWPLLQ